MGKPVAKEFQSGMGRIDEFADDDRVRIQQELDEQLRREHEGLAKLQASATESKLLEAIAGDLPIEHFLNVRGRANDDFSKLRAIANANIHLKNMSTSLLLKMIYGERLTYSITKSAGVAIRRLKALKHEFEAIFGNDEDLDEIFKEAIAQIKTLQRGTLSGFNRDMSMGGDNDY